MHSAQTTETQLFWGYWTQLKTVVAVFPNPAAGLKLVWLGLSTLSKDVFP